jgi:hypothetical protein
MLKNLIFASALSLFMAGNAVAVSAPWSATISIGGTDYDVTLLSGTWLEHEAQLMLTPWWGLGGIALDAAVASDDLAVPASTYFAYDTMTIAGTERPLSRMTQGGTIFSGAMLSLPTADRSWAYAPLEVAAVPIPAAGWLFMSALIGLMGKKRLSRRSVH